MKNELIELMSQKQDTLKQMLDDCPDVNGTPKDDILQDFYLFLFEKDYRLLSVEHMFPEGEFNRGLVFTVLRNFVYGEIRKDVARTLKKDEAYRAWKFDKLQEDDSRVRNLTSASNLLILNELRKDLTDEEYDGIIDLIERNMLAKFTDKDGNRDMTAYRKKYNRLNKKYKEVKTKSQLFKYMTANEIGLFEKFTTLTLKSI